MRVDGTYHREATIWARWVEWARWAPWEWWAQWMQWVTQVWATCQVTTIWTSIHFQVLAVLKLVKRNSLMHGVILLWSLGNSLPQLRILQIFSKRASRQGICVATCTHPLKNCLATLWTHLCSFQWMKLRLGPLRPVSISKILAIQMH